MADRQAQQAKSVAVVIPCYRPTLKPFERAALQRCCRVLAAYPQILVVPQTLDVSAIVAEFPQLAVERFEDHFFAGIDGYNRLMLDDGFYARFATWEFILIHQLDALVFRDELPYWCARGFDYIGAPWLRDGFRGRFDEWRVSVKRWLYRRLDIKDRDGVALHTAQINFGVGNGGFSLRRVAAMRAVLAACASALVRYRQRPDHSYNEDSFFGIEANRRQRRLRIPGYAEAARFAWEFSPQFAQRLTAGQLPFGCHGWDKFHRDFWRPIFAAEGLELDALLAEPSS